MKRLILFILLAMCLASCSYDEIPAGKAIVTSIRVRKGKDKRIYKAVLKPIDKMRYNEVVGIWCDTEGFIIYTDSLLQIGDTIDILK